MVERSIRIKADEAARDLAALNINLEEHIPLGRIHLDIALDTQEVVLRWEEADNGEAPPA